MYVICKGIEKKKEGVHVDIITASLHAIWVLNVDLDGWPVLDIIMCKQQCVVVPHGWMPGW